MIQACDWHWNIISRPSRRTMLIIPYTKCVEVCINVSLTPKFLQWWARACDTCVHTDAAKSIARPPNPSLDASHREQAQSSMKVAEWSNACSNKIDRKPCNADEAIEILGSIVKLSRWVEQHGHRCSLYHYRDTWNNNTMDKGLSVGDGLINQV